MLCFSQVERLRASTANAASLRTLAARNAKAAQDMEETRKKKRLFAATILGVQVVVAGIGLGMLEQVIKDGGKGAGGG